MITLLSEDDYTETMHTDCAAWRKEHVRTEEIKSFDGTRLCCYHAAPAQAKALVFMVHGFCEFFGKYHEMAWYLYRSGYAFVFPELRGHGHSGGKLSEPDVVYVDSFDTYVQDLRRVLDELVLPRYGHLRKIVFAHSMGGAISALFLERYPEAFSRCLLSSPMFRVDALAFPAPVYRFLRLYVKLCRKEKAIAPGQKRFDPYAPFHHSGALSEARYEYFMEQRRTDVYNRTWGASYGWSLAASRAMKRLLREAPAIRAAVTLFAAGRDNMVSLKGFDLFAARVPRMKRINYPESGHEIFNAGDSVRKKYYHDLFRELEKQAAPEEGKGA